MAVAYLQIEGVPGESTNSGHEEWIEVDDVQQVLQQTAKQSAGTTAMVQGRAQGAAYTVHKRVDRSSPVLMEHCVAGQNIKKVKIEFVRTSNGKSQLYMQVEMETVIVSEVHSHITDGNLGESVTFIPTKIKWVYTEHKDGVAAGNTPGGWDFSKDTK